MEVMMIIGKIDYQKLFRENYFCDLVPEKFHRSFFMTELCSESETYKKSFIKYFKDDQKQPKGVQNMIRIKNIMHEP